MSCLAAWGVCLAFLARLGVISKSAVLISKSAGSTITGRAHRSYAQRTLALTHSSTSFIATAQCRQLTPAPRSAPVPVPSPDQPATDDDRRRPERMAAPVEQSRRFTRELHNRLVHRFPALFADLSPGAEVR